MADEFVRGLAAAGTTSALVFGAHFSEAIDTLFAAASGSGLRITSGLVVSDRCCAPTCSPRRVRAYTESLALAYRWHGVGRNRYAVTPRFSLSCTDELLATCGDLLEAIPGALFTSHVNENEAEIATVAELFGGSDYVSDVRASTAWSIAVACSRTTSTRPTSNSKSSESTARASPTARPATQPSAAGCSPCTRHLQYGVRVALGSDVGAGTGFSLLKEGLQAYFCQQLLADQGRPLTGTHLLYLATTAGAEALNLTR